MPDSLSLTGATGFSLVAQWFHWGVSWRPLGRVLVGMGALATLVALFYAEENLRGRYAWRRYRHQLEGQGAQLDWQAYVPSPVPDNQNFAMTPFLAPLFDFNPDYQENTVKPFPWRLFDSKPKPILPGQSRWRDTNGFNKAMHFAEELRLAAVPAWTKRQFTDFQAAIDKSKAKAPEAKTPSTRAESATELLGILKRHNAVFDELRTASQRPYARFNINYTNAYAPAILLPHLGFLVRANLAYQMRASAELALEHTDAAWSAAKMTLYLSDTIEAEPFIVSQLVRNRMVQRSLQPIWEGLAARQWSEAQLREIELCLGQVAILNTKTLWGELAFGHRTLDQMRTQSELDWSTWTIHFTEVALPHFLIPNGWFYQNQIAFTQTYQELVLPIIDGPAQRVYPTKAAANMELLMKEYPRGFSPYRFLSLAFFFSDQRQSEFTPFEAVKMLAVGQTQVNEAIVACALERYRLAKGRFPETLPALSPQFLAKIPSDVITGEPLKYRRHEDGQFILYSVGWNLKDEGGIMVTTQDKKSTVDYTQGDWVWQYPEQ
jgi:hypothetical protein